MTSTCSCPQGEECDPYKVAGQFQLACLQLRHRVEEVFAFLKTAFGAGRTTQRAAHALTIHLLCCLLAYALYKSLIA